MTPTNPHFWFPQRFWLCTCIPHAFIGLALLAWSRPLPLCIVTSPSIQGSRTASAPFPPPSCLLLPPCLHPATIFSRLFWQEKSVAPRHQGLLQCCMPYRHPVLLVFSDPSVLAQYPITCPAWFLSLALEWMIVFILLGVRSCSSTTCLLVHSALLPVSFHLLGGLIETLFWTVPGF